MKTDKRRKIWKRNWGEIWYLPRYRYWWSVHTMKTAFRIWWTLPGEPRVITMRSTSPWELIRRLTTWQRNAGTFLLNCRNTWQRQTGLFLWVHAERFPGHDQKMDKVRMRNVWWTVCPVILCSESRYDLWNWNQRSVITSDIEPAFGFKLKGDRCYNNYRGKTYEIIADKHHGTCTLVHDAFWRRRHLFHDQGVQKGKGW